MASQTATIPRFLLPRARHMFRRAGFQTDGTKTKTGQLLLFRFASTKPPSAAKQPVLEKPARFNPPSHGARLPKRTTPRHYGGELNEQQVRAQGRKDYPGLMAPKGTWAHWVWHSKGLHLFISVGTLTLLATFVSVENWRQNFERNSPYADMLPSYSDFLSSPIASTRTVIEVIRLNSMHEASQVQELRTRRVDDVAKRKEYRKAHGMEEVTGLPWFSSKAEAEPEPAAKIPAAEKTSAPEVESPAPRKKWLGIF